jgi:hypothetical protein
VEASAEALVATARLAPETFPPPTVEHLFKLLETGQGWAAEAAFDVLRILAAEPERLVKCATMFLALGTAEKIAAGIIRDGAQWVSLTDVPRILPALIDLACPLNAWMPGRRRAPVPEPFLALHSAHTAAVEAALETNLWIRNDLHKVGSAARGILVLSERDGSTAVRLSRATISRLARGNDIPDRQSGERDILDDLRTAASAAFGHDPDGTDEMMTAFQTGASDTGKGRVFSIYRQILTREPDDLPVARAARVLAMQRTLDAVTGDMPSEVQREVEDAFQGHSSYLLDLIGEKSDGLLGAAVLLEGRLRESPKRAAGETNAIERMEAYGRRSGLEHLRDNLVSLVARSAKGKVQSIRAYLAVLAGLPDELDEFRGLMLRHLNVLVTTPETLGLILPTLYSSLVGSSSLARGRAAKVVGELSPRQREDAPPLLLEALVALLRDPFVYPISSTVSALRYIKLPDTLEKRAARCLADIIGSGPGNKTQSRLVCDCIRLFAGRYATKEQLAGRAGETLVAILEQQSPENYAENLRFLPDPLPSLPGFGRLVVKALQDGEQMSRRSEDVFSALRRLGAVAVQAARDALLNIALKTLDSREGNQARGVFIEVFSAVGDWDAAVRVAEHSLAIVPDTRRDGFRRVTLSSLLVSVRYERAIAEGRSGDLQEMAAEWRGLQQNLADMRT